MKEVTNEEAIRALKTLEKRLENQMSIAREKASEEQKERLFDKPADEMELHEIGDDVMMGY